MNKIVKRLIGFGRRVTRSTYTGSDCMLQHSMSHLERNMEHPKRARKETSHLRSLTDRHHRLRQQQQQQQQHDYSRQKHLLCFFFTRTIPPTPTLCRNLNYDVQCTYIQTKR